MARLRFAKFVSHGEESFNCHRTNHLVRINSDGSLEYEEICQTRAVTHTGDTHPPTLVPADEAKRIKKGDTVSVIGKESDARIVDVKRGEKVVQVWEDVVVEP
jgi:hypothetical protein